MQIQTQRTSGDLNLVQQMVYSLFSCKTCSKNGHFSDDDGDKPDTRFVLLGNGLCVNWEMTFLFQCQRVFGASALIGNNAVQKSNESSFIQIKS